MKLSANYIEQMSILDTTAKESLHSKEKKDTLAKDKDDKKTYKYELVGTMIKVMLLVNGVEVSCVKSIPVQNASPEIIAKIENLTFIDMVMINDLQKEKDQPKEDVFYIRISI